MVAFGLGVGVRQGLTTCALIAVVACGPRDESPIKPGDLIFAVDPDHLIEVEYTSPQLRIVARRWTTSEPFMVTFERVAGRQFERCQADERLLASLLALTTVRARDGVSSAEAERAARNRSDWGTLRIREDAHREPLTIFIRPAAPPLARSFGSDTTFKLHDTNLDLLHQRCPQRTSSG